MKQLLGLAVSVWFVADSGVLAGEIRAIAWNVESGESDPDVIAEEIADFEDYDIWALSEVPANAAMKYVIGAAAGENSFFHFKLGRTGGGDRLLLIWDSRRFAKVDEVELNHLKFGGGRAPLAVRLKELPDGPEFWAMVNHLHRNSAPKRNKQARGLKQWMAQQDIPVFMLGDFNLDFKVPDGPGNAAFRMLLSDDTVKWVQPSQLVRTQSSSNSVLDFVFVNDLALTWNPRSEIIVQDGDFEPEASKSDHRPVDVVFTATFQPEEFIGTPERLVRRDELTGQARTLELPAERPVTPDDPIEGPTRGEGRSGFAPAGPPRTADEPVTREALLDRIEKMQRELDELEGLVRQLDGR